MLNGTHLKINKWNIKPNKWYLRFFSHAIINNICPIEIEIQNIGSENFSGGFIKMKHSPYHRDVITKIDFYRNNTEVDREKLEIGKIEKGKIVKITKYSCNIIGHYSGNIMLYLRINLKNEENLTDEQRKIMLYGNNKDVIKENDSLIKSFQILSVNESKNLFISTTALIFSAIALIISAGGIIIGAIEKIYEFILN